ncbi:N-formylglutamate amidohydrolase [Kordiimonas aquimaris]|uniref:N-formylglutamate amidohydrolase n=1 Tax=Kordiimonas aquimaris TaxID=707591 RepID=UPI0021CE6699|nr:N-formylglutamate amidohydrolase [Kordiimonas aquimaris]
MEQPVLINPDAREGIILLCDHATNHVPHGYDNLGLTPDVLEEHIAYDIGAEDVTRKICEMMGVAAVLGPVSRLLIDCNREPGRSSMIPTASDGITIPANNDLTEKAIKARMDAYYYPFHTMCETLIAEHMDAGLTPLLVAVHSFTPAMAGEDRPWHVGFLWNQDPRLAQAMIGLLERETDLVIGDNLPYSGKDLYYTMQRHGADHGLPQTTLEIRQDLVDTEEKTTQWAALIADVLDECMERNDLKQRKLYPVSK